MDSVINWGPALAFAGVSFAGALGAAGSSLGCGKAGEACASVSGEKPELFVKMLILQALPGSQVIYGFVIAALILFGTFGDVSGFNAGEGAQVFFAGLTIGLAALASGMFQGRVIAAGAQAVAKDANQLVNVIVFAAVVETFAIFGFLISFLMIQGMSA